MRGLVVLVAATALSAVPTSVALAVSPAQPINRTPPTIAGSPKPGHTLTASPGEWSGDAPIHFDYSWFRSTENDYRSIPGAREPTYRVSEADATSSVGHKVLLTVVVTGTNDVAYGFATPAYGVTVRSRPVRPDTRTHAMLDAIAVGGPQSTIPRLLAHNGYRTSYWALQRGRIDVAWALDSAADPYVKKLAAAHATLRHRGSIPLKIRLTRWGRHRLRHAHHLTIDTDISFKPRGRPGGDGVGKYVELDDTVRADDAKLIVPTIQVARARLAQPISFWAGSQRMADIRS